MNIVYISVQRDQTGYSHAANDMILALDTAGANVQSVWVTLSELPKPQLPEQLEQLEDNTRFDKADVVIQHILPQFFVRVPNAYNIGYFHYETNHFRGSNWQYFCNLMDEIWVLTLDNKKMCEDSGVTVPITVVDSPIDDKKFQNQKYKPIFENTDNRFLFYTISEISYRKGVLALLAAFRSAFSYTDQVGLVVKGFLSGADNKTAEEEFDGIMETIKVGIRKGPAYRPPPVMLITEWLSENQICRLHNNCHCFVTMSRGESLCIPLLDAACFGNACIAPDWNGPQKILSPPLSRFHKLVPTTPKGVFGQTGAPSHLYNCDEIWHEPSLLEAARAMKDIYNSWRNNQEAFQNSLLEAAEELRYRYDYETVGKNLLAYLKIRTQNDQNNNESSALGIQKDQYEKAETI